MTTTIAHWVALSLVVGSRTLARLVERFGTPEAALAAAESDLCRVPRITPQVAAAIRAIDLDQTRAAVAAWQADGIAIALNPDVGQPPPSAQLALFNAPPAERLPEMDVYPEALRSLGDAPPVLFARGSVQPGDARAVAVVGTRRPAPDSEALAARLATELAARGWTVVSGLAEGIDTAAHSGALQAGGRTLAVLGCGARVAYPPQNADLAAQVTRGGALLSETHPDAAPTGPALVARNRIITGLSRAVIVVETGATGGTLHAARFARRQGRALFALDIAAAGNQQLIAAGAQPLALDTTAWDRVFDC